MNIAYIISAYKNSGQLVRLVRRLSAGGTSFFIHIDRKSRAEIFEGAFQQLRDIPDLRFLPRHRCHWGDFGHVRATLKGIHTLVTSGTPFDYAVLLTGQDYPVQSHDRIARFFAQAGGKSYLSYFPLPHEEWEHGGLDRIQRWHWRVLGRHISFPASRGLPLKRSFPAGFAPYGGSSYWCLSRACVQYIHDFVGRNPAFVSFFHTVDVPDEIFFQTLLLNSPLASALVNDDLRYIDWKDPDAGSPGLLVTEDFERIAGSGKLFARKFDETIDHEILDLLDRHIDRSRAGALKHHA
jgi:hypothetical protein